MGGFGSPIHWLVIGVIALLLFGNRLPEVARSIGRAFREFKKGLSDINDEMSTSEKESRKRDELHAPREERSIPRSEPQAYRETPESREHVE